jgi:hypothetical protein
MKEKGDKELLSLFIITKDKINTTLPIVYNHDKLKKETI